MMAIFANEKIFGESCGVIGHQSMLVAESPTNQDESS